MVSARPNILQMLDADLFFYYLSMTKTRTIACLIHIGIAMQNRIQFLPHTVCEVYLQLRSFQTIYKSKVACIHVKKGEGGPSP